MSEGFRIRSDRSVECDGVPVSTAAAAVGSTCMYLYSVAQLRKNIEAYQAALQALPGVQGIVGCAVLLVLCAVEVVVRGL